MWNLFGSIFSAASYQSKSHHFEGFIATSEMKPNVWNLYAFSDATGNTFFLKSNFKRNSLVDLWATSLLRAHQRHFEARRFHGNRKRIRIQVKLLRSIANQFLSLNSVFTCNGIPSFFIVKKRKLIKTHCHFKEDDGAYSIMSRLLIKNEIGWFSLRFVCQKRRTGQIYELF